MKTDKYQRRFYRDWIKVKDLCVSHIIVKETDLEILTDKLLDKNFARERVDLYRRQIETYISRDRRFLTSLKPIEVELTAPLIVKKMGEAAKEANVGPMAAVAGAIAQFLGRDLLRKGYREVIIENGGDIFLKICRPRCVGIYTGKQRLKNKLFLRIKPQDTPLGICTSSGTVGHSLSFGCADSVTILSKDASIADAVATATCNRINSAKDLGKAMDFVRSIEAICGAVVIFKKTIACWGKIEFKTLDKDNIL